MSISKLALAEAAEVVSGSIATNGLGVGHTVDCLHYNTVSVQITGTFVGTLTFGVSNDGVTWVTKYLLNPSNGLQSVSATAPTMWTGDIGARYFRVRSTAWTSGQADVIVIFAAGSSANLLATQTVGGTIAVVGAGTTSIAKSEDAAAGTGDLGVPAFGVRSSSTTPSMPTSAAGDWGWLLIDAEGKLITTLNSDAGLSFQSRTDLTTTSDVSLQAAAGAGVRNYVTDITVENTGGAAVRFLLRDGTTTIWSCTVPANSTFKANFQTPLRGTANTVINGQLGAAGTATISVEGFKGI